MSCPTCDHTTHRVRVGESKTWWCPRCGTLSDYDGVAQAPQLVGRVRELHKVMAESQRWNQETWHRLGLLEAVYRPEDRLEGR